MRKWSTILGHGFLPGWGDVAHPPGTPPPTWSPISGRDGVPVGIFSLSWDTRNMERNRIKKRCTFCDSTTAYVIWFKDSSGLLQQRSVSIPYHETRENARGEESVIIPVCYVHAHAAELGYKGGMNKDVEPEQRRMCDLCGKDWAQNFYTNKEFVDYDYKAFHLGLCTECTDALLAGYLMDYFLVMAVDEYLGKRNRGR